jgi:hypothetical protein
MAFGAAGLEICGRDPSLSPADQAHGFLLALQAWKFVDVD